jgi:hypothetical protein
MVITYLFNNLLDTQNFIILITCVVPKKIQKKNLPHGFKKNNNQPTLVIIEPMKLGTCPTMVFNIYLLHKY